VYHSCPRRVFTERIEGIPSDLQQSSRLRGSCAARENGPRRGGQRQWCGEGCEERAEWHSGRFSEERLKRWREYSPGGTSAIVLPGESTLLVADSGEVILLPWKHQDPFAAREYALPFVAGFGDLQCQIRICSTDGVSVERLRLRRASPK